LYAAPRQRRLRDQGVRSTCGVIVKPISAPPRYATAPTPKAAAIREPLAHFPFYDDASSYYHLSFLVEDAFAVRFKVQFNRSRAGEW
jgi:hypothetical protein